jgi:hypothetical protein
LTSASYAQVDERLHVAYFVLNAQVEGVEVSATDDGKQEMQENASHAGQDEISEMTERAVKVKMGCATLNLRSP